MILKFRYDLKIKMEVMLDLETLSTRPHAVILIIGAAKFSRYGTIPASLKEMNTFYRRVDIESCKDLGMHTDLQTLKWWNSQDEKIREEAFGGERIPIKQALYDFSNWFQNSREIWSQGASFDIPILEEAYKRAEIEIPWKFWNSRDTRTVYDIAGIKSWDLPQDNKHNALFDCWRQIYGVKKAFDELSKKSINYLAK